MTLFFVGVMRVVPDSKRHIMTTKATTKNTKNSAENKSKTSSYFSGIISPPKPFRDFLPLKSLQKDLETPQKTESEIYQNTHSELQADIPHIARALSIPVPWGIDRINQKNLPLDGTYSSAYSGKGVDVYLVDTGLDTTHQVGESRGIGLCRVG